MISKCINHPLCCDYIMKYSQPIGFSYFYRPINIILSADWSDYIKDITCRLPKSVPKLYNRCRPMISGRPTHRPMICESFKYEIGRSSADHRVIAKPQNCRPMEKKYNEVVIIYFLSADEKRAKIWHFIGR